MLIRAETSTILNHFLYKKFLKVFVCSSKRREKSVKVGREEEEERREERGRENREEKWCGVSSC